MLPVKKSNSLRKVFDRFFMTFRAAKSRIRMRSVADVAPSELETNNIFFRIVNFVYRSASTDGTVSWNS